VETALPLSFSIIESNGEGNRKLQENQEQGRARQCEARNYPHTVEAFKRRFKARYFNYLIGCELCSLKKDQLILHEIYRTENNRRPMIGFELILKS